MDNAITHPPISDEALQLAAQCWQDEETSSIEMDSRLARAFAKRIDSLRYEITKLENMWADAAARNVTAKLPFDSN